MRVCVRNIHAGREPYFKLRVTVMLVSSDPSMLQACRVDRLFGNSITQRSSCRVRTLRRLRSAPGCVIVAATQTGVKSLVKDHGAISVQGTSRKRNEDRFDLQVHA